MKALYERWTAISLPKRILGGMILGAVLGMVIPQAVGISILGNLFVNALKGIAPAAVFSFQCCFFPISGLFLFFFRFFMNKVLDFVFTICSQFSQI